jgi:phosphoribosylamine--glycine ligase
MNILLIGSGGREHAMAWKLRQSARCDELYIAPGNAGTQHLAKQLPIAVDQFEAIAQACREHGIQLVIVGPEVPLVKGLRDYLEGQPDLKDLLIVGPGKSGARLEGSKDFSKQFMVRHGIPTAKAHTFSAAELTEGLHYLKTCSVPIVLKADGLAAGKGVVICPTHEEATRELTEMLAQAKFGAASAKVLVEEFLVGIEVSFFVLTDGTHYCLLPEAKDYKRVGDGDTGLNTGGMGAVSPVIFADQPFREKVIARIIEPTLNGLQQEGIPFRGFLFIGLMNVDGEPYVIEYNVRRGDPETQAVLPRVTNDWVDVMVACANGTLDQIELQTAPDYAVTVCLVSGGYPESFEKGFAIKGLDNDPLLFHAGTRVREQEIVTDGGRVLAVTGMAPSLEQARGQAYAKAGRIAWNNLYYRKDIGVDLQSMERGTGQN